MKELEILNPWWSDESWEEKDKVFKRLEKPKTEMGSKIGKVDL